MMSQAGATGWFNIRTVEPDGRRGTLGGAPEPDGTILDADHAAAMTGQKSKDLGGEVRMEGVVDAEIIVDRAAYDELSSQANDVFLVDIMRAVAVDHLPSEVSGQVSMSAVHLEPLYWHLEDDNLTAAPQS